MLDEVVEKYSIIHPVLKLLDYFARNIASEFHLQKIILIPSTGVYTIAFLAENLHTGPLIEFIAENQRPILNTVGIVESLSKNPSIRGSTLNRIISSFKLYLTKKDEVPLLKKLMNLFSMGLIVQMILHREL